MHDYLLSSEWIRFAFVLGVAVSMVLYEKRHLTTGSIVVPGYIAVFLIHPLVIVATFLNALATYWIVNHVLRRYFLLYGRTKFTLLAIISTLIQTAMLRITPSGRWLWEMDIPLFIGVGYIVPGLIAHDMARQGVSKTVKSVLLAGAIVAVPIALALAFDLPGVNELAPIDGFGSLAFEVHWLPFAVVLSVVASWAVAINYGLRSGGFVGAAFTGMFMADPWQVVAAIGVAVITYLVVAKFLMRHMILFGRRKFSSMLLVSSMVAWVCMWFGGRFLNADWEQHLGVGSLALTPLLLPGLIANDSQRTSPQRVLAGLVLAGSFVVTTTWWAQATVSGIVAQRWAPIVSVSTALVLFGPQLQLVVAKAAARLPSLPSLPSLPNVRFRRSMAALASGATTERALSLTTPWEAWSVRHPDHASEAEAWLDAQLAKFTRPRPSMAAAGGFDLASASVLQLALDTERGARRIPRAPVPPVYQDERQRLSLAEISETFDPTREAQLLGSDVSDYNAHPADEVAPAAPTEHSPMDPDATQPLARPDLPF